MFSIIANVAQAIDSRIARPSIGGAIEREFQSEDSFAQNDSIALKTGRRRALLVYAPLIGVVAIVNGYAIFIELATSDDLRVLAAAVVAACAMASLYEWVTDVIDGVRRQPDRHSNFVIWVLTLFISEILVLGAEGFYSHLRSPGPAEKDVGADLRTMFGGPDVNDLLLWAAAMSVVVIGVVMAVALAYTVLGPRKHQRQEIVVNVIRMSALGSLVPLVLAPLSILVELPFLHARGPLQAVAILAGLHINIWKPSLLLTVVFSLTGLVIGTLAPFLRATHPASPGVRIGLAATSLCMVIAILLPEGHATSSGGAINYFWIAIAMAVIIATWSMATRDRLLYHCWPLVAVSVAILMCVLALMFHPVLLGPFEHLFGSDETDPQHVHQFVFSMMASIGFWFTILALILWRVRDSLISDNRRSGAQAVNSPDAETNRMFSRTLSI
jgi:hypothetical protein